MTSSVLWTDMVVVIIDIEHPNLSRHYILCLHAELACLCLDSRSLRCVHQTCLFCVNKQKKRLASACFQPLSLDWRMNQERPCVSASSTLNFLSRWRGWMMSVIGTVQSWRGNVCSCDCFPLSALILCLLIQAEVCLYSVNFIVLNRW